MRYNYILEGYDKDWKATWDEGVRYENLPVGEYTFKAIAINRDLVYSEKPAALKLRVIADPKDKVINELKAEIRERARELEEAKEIERLKSEFISTVSHELRTPLTSIRGALGLILGGISGEISEQTKALIDMAYKNSERLTRLINDILDIANIESGKMDFNIKSMALIPLVEQAIEANRLYAQQFGVNFGLKVMAGDNLNLRDVKVKVDGDRLIQVLTNLLSNAVKFSPTHDEVVISVTGDDKSKSIRISISDHGPGIPEAFRARVFQKFAQADASDSRQKGGSGLGLSLAKAIVEKLGGKIGFETQTDVGTTFYVDLLYEYE